MKVLRSPTFQILAVMLLAAAWKMLFLFWAVVPFNSDEAIVALMARHILQGGRPVFFYGQAYMGSLDAFLVAAGFALFGQQVLVIRAVQALLYLGIVFSTIWIGQQAFDSLPSGILAAALIAIPTVNVNLYTTASLGGYGEALLLGNLVLLVALILAGQVRQADRTPCLLFALWGLLVGLGLWANGLTLVYSAPTGIYLLWALRKCRSGWLAAFLLTAGAGFVLGSLPWWIFAITNGPDRLILELFGTAVAVERVPWIARTAQHLMNFLLLGTTVTFGFRPPWAVRWLGLPLMPFVLIFWMAVLGSFYRSWMKDRSGRGAYALLAGVAGTLLAGFLVTPFGADPSGRYFLPLAVPLGLAAAQLVRSARSFRPWFPAVLVGLVLIYQLWGNLDSALRFPPGLTTQFDETTIIDHRYDQELIDFLKAHGETYGYSTYWVAYPIAFHSQESLIFVPRLPYHQDMRYTPRDDRYAPYTDQVRASRRAAYITTRNPQLDRYLRVHFEDLGVRWEERQIGDFHVYFRLSRLVRPEDIGLGGLIE